MIHKNFVIVQQPQTPLFRIKFEGGGQIPDELCGSWTNRVKCQLAVDQYLAKKTSENKARTARRKARAA